MNIFWNGRHWESVETYFAVLQRALWVGLEGYSGELWAPEKVCPHCGEVI